jgi:alpha-tubulin suppressor-like RCC1 family protein
MRTFSIWVVLGLLAAPVMVRAQTMDGAGGAMAFRGPTSYVQIASNASFNFGNVVTFEAWVNPSTAASLATIISRGDGGGSATDYIVQLQKSGNGFVLAFFGVGAWDYSVGIIPSNVWTHVAFTYDGTTKQFFTNGVSAGTALRSGSLYVSGSPIYIGRQGAACNCNFYNGMIDEVRVWNTVRTSTQISQNLNRPLTGTEAGLVAYYKFDHISGIATRDSSTNGNTGTLVNRPVPVISGAPFPLQTFALLGPNVLTNDCHTPVTIPGSIFRASPVRLSATRYGFFVVGQDQIVRGWGQNQFGETNIPPGISNVIAVAGTDSPMIGLKSDGTLVAWGDNSVGQTNVPASATNVIAVAAGSFCGLALKLDGTIVGWGDNSSGHLNIPANATNIVAISASYAFVLALRGDGTVVGWGDNSSGQTSVPAAATNVVAVTCAFNSAMALRADGTLVAWGDNFYGETNIPPSATNVVGIGGLDAGFNVLKADGSVVAWGYNGGGLTNVPPIATNIIEIASGSLDVVGLRADGTLIAWGVQGETNVPSDIENVGSPVVTKSSFDLNTPGSYPLTYIGTNVAGTTFTNSRTLVVADLTPPRLTVLGANPMILTSGQAFADPGATAYDQCYGDETSGIVASGIVNTNVPGLYQRRYTVVDSTGNSRTAVRSVYVLTSQPSFFLAGANPFTNECHTAFNDPLGGLRAPPRGIFAGGHDCIVIKADGTLAAWGVNTFGQTNIPPEATNVVSVAVGFDQDVAVRADGTVVAWGSNSAGQTNVPASATNVVTAASGRDFSMVLRADGTVVAWGLDSNGQTDVPPSATNVVAIAAGYVHGLALKSDGTLLAWGSNSSGQTNVPVAATNIVAISAADLYNLALRADGRVLAWGNNGSGQLNVPASATNVIAIAAGGATGFALRGDGVLVAWGFNGTGETNIPVSVTNLIAIAAGDQHALAMRADGTIIPWGGNQFGQINMPANVSFSPIAFGINGVVNTNTPGVYGLTYTATNGATVLTNSRTVVVADRLAPVITVTGANPLQLTVGTPYIEPGVTATDACAGDLTGSIHVGGGLNTSVPGIYTVTYDVMDPTGNSAATNNRTVVVTAPPSLGGFAQSLTATDPNTAIVAERLSATINPNGLDSTAYIQFGLNTSYSAPILLTNVSAAYTASGFSAVMGNLSRAVVYHWRAVGSNSLGAVYGPDQLLLVPGLAVPGDLNGDGVISGDELSGVLSNYFSTSPWLYLTNVAGLGQSNVTFQLTNSLDGAFSVQVSTNLTDWQPLGSAIPFYKFQDTNAPGAPTRYYRLMRP